MLKGRLLTTPTVRVYTSFAELIPKLANSNAHGGLAPLAEVAVLPAPNPLKSVKNAAGGAPDWEIPRFSIRLMIRYLAMCVEVALAVPLLLNFHS
jgi:hypothetical protein